MPDFDDEVEREDAPPTPVLSSSLLVDMDEEPPASAPNVAELQGEEQHDTGTSSMDVTLGLSARVDSESGNITSPFPPC